MARRVEARAESNSWAVRNAALTASVIGVTALLAVSSDKPQVITAALGAMAAVSLPTVWWLGRNRAQVGQAIALAVAVALTVLAQLLLFGARPLLSSVACVPFVVVAAASLGPSSAHVVANAIVLAWAAVGGLSAGGLLTIGPAPPAQAARALVELASSALLLNLVALAASWGARRTDPILRAELQRLETERDRATREFEAVQPLAAAGRLVANVAHEVSNPLQAMDHFLFVLLEETSESDPRHEHLLLVKQGIDRITQYVEQLSDFYRPSSTAGVADVNRVVGDVCRFLARQLGNANVKLQQELSPDAPPAAISEDQLRQALLNVILNAVEAMLGGGELTVSTERSDDKVIVAVRDTGCGIDPEDLDRIFEPFFTTKSDQGGTGLGLSITQRILRKHSGEVSVESALESGTLVTLNLPGAR